jgi:hypothetical protein
MAVSPRDRLGDELAGEPLELGLDLDLDELDELGAVHLERSCDGLGNGVGERSVRHGASVRPSLLPR